MIYRSIMFRTATISLLCAVGAVAVGACAKSTVEDPDTGGSGGTSAGGQQPGGAGGGGTSAGGTGGDGGSSACAIDCTTLTDDQCMAGLCNEATGQCVVELVDDGTPCDDELFCTTGDSCVQGECIGGPENDCGITPPVCQEMVCQESAQSCGTQMLPDGVVCTQADPCIVNSACSSGACVGNPKDCTFAPVPDECHVAECDPLSGDCVPVVGNEGQPCDDPSDLCTVNKTCAAGVCSGGTPVDCSSLTQGCIMGICDPTDGSCTTQAAGQGQPCDDLDPCTTGEICTSGVCGGGSPITTCSATADGCCPSSCTPSNDYDCNCPGTYVNGTCVYLADPNSLTLAQAQATCQGLGAGWGICSATILCDTQTLTYLGTTSCDCNLGPTHCACSTTANLYIHTGATHSHWIRTPLVPNCDWAGSGCTVSGTATCGAALCCRI